MARLRFDGRYDTLLDPDELETHLKHKQSHRLGHWRSSSPDYWND